jgi:hypothetical protein
LSQVFTETGQLDAALDISLSSAAALEPSLRGDRSGPQGMVGMGRAAAHRRHRRRPR